MSLNKVRQMLASVRPSRGMVAALWAGVGLLVIGLTFWAGVTVGGRGASQSARLPALPFGRPFGGPRGGMGHGAFGSITRIEGNSITIMDPRFGQPRTISINPGTLIERGFHERMRAGDLHVGDNITVIGSPLSGNTIQARFIGVAQQSPLNFERFHAPPRPGPRRWGTPRIGSGRHTLGA